MSNQWRGYDLWRLDNPYNDYDNIEAPEWYVKEEYEQYLADWEPECDDDEPYTFDEFKENNGGDMDAAWTEHLQWEGLLDKNGKWVRDE